METRFEYIQLFVLLTVLSSENEFSINPIPSYMTAIEAKFKEDGMTVPTTFNDAWTADNFANGPGAVDVYGWDSYPLGFDCSNPETWPSGVSTTFRDYHASTNPTEPMALFEFQGGSFDAWGVCVLPLLISIERNCN
jgi:hypothetical protein